MERELSVKVVIVGAVGVGKSSITIRYVHNQFHQNIDSTLGAIYFEKTHQLNAQKVKFQFWDTAGQERYKAIARIYYKDCKVALVIYDVTNRQSFESLKMWIQQLKQNGPQNVLLAIVGNKIDLQSSNSVSYEQASSYAKSESAIFKYVSAKDGKGICQLFNVIAERLFERNDLVRKKKQQLKKSVVKEKGCC